MSRSEAEKWERAQIIANAVAPEKADPLAFWCLVEAIMAVGAKCTKS